MIKNKSEQTGIVNRWLPLAAFLTTRCTHNWTRHYRATPTSVTKPAGHGFPGRGSPGNTSSAASKTNKMNIYPKKILNFTFSYRNISFIVKFKTNTVGRNVPLYIHIHVFYQINHVFQMVANCAHSYVITFLFKVSHSS